ncbi:hypothetical protein LJR230_004013 [Trinickia sp. LjRoot230]|uniref:hypothetical protein n=1 Tax=Trinickia sp. LjRoot230 TaxID=3342288 RepID=UPI003ECCD0B2
MNGPLQAMMAICLQSVGQVLYSYFLPGVPEPLFVLGSFLFTAIALNIKSGFTFAIARRDCRLLVQNNLYTAITYLCFFFALRRLDPSVVVAIDTGVALVVGAICDSVQRRAWPSSRRLIICAGIVAACILLGARQFGNAGHASLDLAVWVAILATAITGASSALTMSVCAELAAKGWSRSQIVSQRFYLTIAATLVWCLLFRDSIHVTGGFHALSMAAVVTLAGVLMPMLLLQSAINSSGPFTVLVCMSVQPFISLLLSTSSRLQVFDARTLAGIAIVSALVVYDVVADQPQPRRKRQRTEEPPAMVSTPTSPA